MKPKQRKILIPEDKDTVKFEEAYEAMHQEHLSKLSVTKLRTLVLNHEKHAKQLEEEIGARMEHEQYLEQVNQKHDEEFAELHEQNQALIKVLKIFIEREKLR